MVEENCTLLEQSNLINFENNIACWLLPIRSLAQNQYANQHEETENWKQKYNLVFKRSANLKIQKDGWISVNQQAAGPKPITCYKNAFAKLFLLVYFFLSKGAYSALVEIKNKPDFLMQKMWQKSAATDALELRAPYFFTKTYIFDNWFGGLD